MVAVNRLWVTLLLMVLGTAAPAVAGLDDLARQGLWAQIEEVALRRGEQLPLRPDEAFIAAVAAGSMGHRDAELRFLELAAIGGPLADLARVELAERVATLDRERALGLVLPELRHAPTREVQEAAATVAVTALDETLPGAVRAKAERLASGLPRDLRRSVEVQLALTSRGDRRQRLRGVLESSVRDLSALAAARALLDEEDLSAEEQWLVAQTLYRHAFYEEALGLLDGLGDGHRSGSLPRWEVAFVEGRCAFRKGDFEGAVEDYRRAIGHAGGGERGADLEVHLARALEFAGRLDDAVTAAQRAVRLRTTDERRLFLARLRLRSGEPGYARLGVARVRTRAARDRGELMLALDELARGQRDAAGRHLESIRRRPWSGPAAVLASEIAAEEGDWAGVAEPLERVGWALSPFWAAQARALLRQAPPEVVEGWRERRRESVHAGSERTRRRNLASWAALEIDDEALSELRGLVAAGGALRVPVDTPPFDPGLAAELWSRGLVGHAARWDALGLPRRDAGTALWSAQRMLDSGTPGPAIVLADAAWRMAGSEVPVRAYPEELERTLYPLPYPELVRRAAARHGVPWPLLAALAREESRWSPVAVSAVGARGLVQLLPETATAVARRLQRPQPAATDLFDPAVSLDLGAAEVARLLAEYDGRWAPAVAAYNAGEAQATMWLADCGDDCSPARYVATIAFAVTRDYTSHVVAGAGVYARLYGAGEAPREAAGR